MITRRSVAIGEVSVVRRRIDVSGATFRVRLNNHQVNLTGDDAAASMLTVAGTAWTAPRWSGDGPGGHNREGTLSFASAGRAAGPVALRLGGLPEPVTVRWTLPQRKVEDRP